MFPMNKQQRMTKGPGMSFKLSPVCRQLLERVKAQENLSYTAIIEQSVREWAAKRGVTVEEAQDVTLREER